MRSGSNSSTCSALSRCRSGRSGRTPAQGDRRIRSGRAGRIGGRSASALMPVDQAAMNTRIPGCAVRPRMESGAIHPHRSRRTPDRHQAPGRLREVRRVRGGGVRQRRELLPRPLQVPHRRNDRCRTRRRHRRRDRWTGSAIRSGPGTLRAGGFAPPVHASRIQLPTAIVGLDVNDWTDVRARYDQMQDLVESNGEVCHSFDAVMGF